MHGPNGTPIQYLYAISTVSIILCDIAKTLKLFEFVTFFDSDTSLFLSFSSSEIFFNCQKLTFAIHKALLKSGMTTMTAKVNQNTIVCWSQKHGVHYPYYVPRHSFILQRPILTHFDIKGSCSYIYKSYNKTISRWLLNSALFLKIFFKPRVKLACSLS